MEPSMYMDPVPGSCYPNSLAPDLGTALVGLPGCADHSRRPPTASLANLQHMGTLCRTVTNRCDVDEVSWFVAARSLTSHTKESRIENLEKSALMKNVLEYFAVC